MKFFLFFLTSIIILEAQIINEFPVEVSPDSTFATSISQDNNKFLGIYRKELGTSGAYINGLFISKSNNSPIGSPYNFGTTDFNFYEFDYALPQVAFDGKNFLVAWTQSGFVKGRFISSVNFQMGPVFNIANNYTITGFNTLHFNTFTKKYFMVLYKIGTNGLDGVFLDTLGQYYSALNITSMKIRKEYSMAYGNGKYLITWIDSTGSDYAIYGQLVNENGSLYGSNFLIDGSPEPSDNPLFVTFDGTKFIVLFPDQEISGWKIYARFVGLDGTVYPSKILVTSTGHIAPSAACISNYILITWTSFDSLKVFGRLFDLSLNPVTSEFAIFSPAGTKFPVGNFTTFTNNKFYVFTTRCNFTGAFVDGDIYGAEIAGLKIDEKGNSLSDKFSFLPYYSKNRISINFNIPFSSETSIELYDLSGKKNITLFKGFLKSGNYKKDFEINKLNSGIYFVIFNALNSQKKSKVLLIK